MNERRRHGFLAAALAASLFLQPGCITSAVWDGYRGRRPVFVEVEREDGEVVRECRMETDWGDTMLRVAATPPAMAIDIGGFILYFWLLDKLDRDDKC